MKSGYVRHYGVIHTKCGDVDVYLDEYRDMYSFSFPGEPEPFASLGIEYVLRNTQERLTDVIERLAGTVKRERIQERQADKEAMRERHRKAAKGNASGMARKDTSRSSGPRRDPGEDPGEGPSRGSSQSSTKGEGASEGVKPDQPLTAVAAWRGWRTEPSSANLSSMSARYTWNHTEVNTAHCGRYQAHDVPTRDCTCGFWAYRSWELMQGHGPEGLSVHGVVGLAGNILEAEYGYRAELARIIALLDTPESRRLKNLWEHGHKYEIHETVRSTDLGIIARIRSDRYSVAPKGGLFPLPLLSAAECELLALDQGFVFEPEPPEAESPKEVYQYIVPLSRPIAGFIAYTTTMEMYGVTFTFAPPEESPYNGIRIDHLLDEVEGLYCDIQIPGYWIGGGSTTITLVKSVVRYGRDNIVLWRFSTGILERDNALALAQNEYGNDWLEQYKLMPDAGP